MDIVGQLNSWELANVLIAGFISLGMFRSNIWGLYFWLAMYCALHFSFSAVPILIGEPFEVVRRQRFEEGAGVIANGVAISMIIVSLFISILRRNEVHVKYLLVAALSCGLLVLGYFSAGGDLTLARVQNAFLLVIMLLLIFFPAIFGATRMDAAKLGQKLVILISVLILMLLVSAVEIANAMAWATFQDSSGAIVRRASGLLFNPNLYAMWAAFVAIMASFLAADKKISFWWCVVILLLAFIGIYLSGSRSMAFLLFFILAAVGVFCRDLQPRIRFGPVVLMVLVFFGTWLVSHSLSHYFPNSESWASMSVLGSRFFNYPMQFSSYILNRLAALSADGALLSFVGQFLSWSGVSSGGYVDPHVAISIEGRFSGVGKDAGWLVLYDEAGPLGLAVVAFLWLLWGVMAIKKYIAVPDHRSVYAISIWIFTLAVGWVMRYQVYPTGVLIGIALSPCVCYWFSVKSKGSQDASR